MSFLALAVIKATVALGAALVIAWAARRAASSTRHAILVAGQIGALVVPLLVFVVPPVAVPVDAPIDVVSVPRAARASGPPSAQGAPEARTAPIPLLQLLWLAGFLAVASARTTSILRAVRVVRRARPFGAVLISDEIDQPATLGRWIVLPANATTWSAARLRAVLLHERAHVERRDSLLGIAGDAVCAIYWFHPLAWISARRARLERERACDDAVLTSGVDASVYATAIVDVARLAVRGRRAAGMAMAERPHLEQRIGAILDPAIRHRASRAARLAVMVVAVAAAPLLAALTMVSIPRPLSGEPDLRGDAVASPYSERIGAPMIDIAASGPDAELIATMQHLAVRPPRSRIDFVADRARWALSRVDGGELVMPLIHSLSDRDWRVRAYAAFGLGVSGDRRATAPLVELLGDSVWRVRAMAASALANIADPAASEAMHRALSDEAWQVRVESVRYFSAIGGNREIFETMRTDRHMAVRVGAEEALQ